MLLLPREGDRRHWTAGGGGGTPRENSLKMSSHRSCAQMVGGRLCHMGLEGGESPLLSHGARLAWPPVTLRLRRCVWVF